jgi:phage gp29-like protein
VDQQMTGVTPEDDQRLAWRMTKDETKLEPIAPYTAIVHAATSPFGALYRRGIGRSIAILYSLKRLGLQTWASYVEMFGLARPVADYPVGSKESDIEAFEEMLQAWAQGGYLLKPANLKVNFPEPASASRGAGEPVHATLAKYCDAQASKRIIGQTMTSDSGSSRAQGEVHERVAGWITEGDAGDMAETVTRDLVEPYVRLNYGMEAPVPKIGALIESSERREFQTARPSRSWCRSA